jgi:hypothetical protein
MHDKCGLIEWTAFPDFNFRPPPSNKYDKLFLQHQETSIGQLHHHLPSDSCRSRSLQLNVEEPRYPLITQWSRKEAYNRSPNTTSRRLGRQDATFYGINSARPSISPRAVGRSDSVEPGLAMCDTMWECSRHDNWVGYRVQQRGLHINSCGDNLPKLCHLPIRKHICRTRHKCTGFAIRIM